MTLSRRLRSLESLALEQGLLSSEPPCPECGGPHETIGVMTVLVDDGETVKECSRCGCVLGKEGKALGTQAVILYLHEGCAEP